MEEPAFLTAAGALDATEARRLRALGRASPRRSAAVFAQALAVRDMLRALLAALDSQRFLEAERLVA